MTKKKQTWTNEQEQAFFYREATQQDFIDVFNNYEKAIKEKLNNFVYRQNDPEVGRLYISYRPLIANWIKLNKEYIKDCPVFEELPILIENNYYAGLTRLAEYCEKVAKKILDKENPPPPEELIVLTENQKKILAYLKKENVVVAQVDIESGTGLSNKTVSNELKPLKKYELVAPPEGKQRRIGITSKGIGSLNYSK